MTAGGEIPKEMQGPDKLKINEGIGLNGPTCLDSYKIADNAKPIDGDATKAANLKGAKAEFDEARGIPPNSNLFTWGIGTRGPNSIPMAGDKSPDTSSV